MNPSMNRADVKVLRMLGWILAAALALQALLTGSAYGGDTWAWPGMGALGLGFLLAATWKADR